VAAPLQARAELGEVARDVGLPPRVLLGDEVRIDDRSGHGGSSRERVAWLHRARLHLGESSAAVGADLRQRRVHVGTEVAQRDERLVAGVLDDETGARRRFTHEEFVV